MSQMQIRLKKCKILISFIWKNVLNSNYSFEKVYGKSTTNKAKSLRTVLTHQEKYHITHALKFGDYNVGREGALLTLPSYMGFLLEFDGVEDVELTKLDIDEVNRMAEEMMKE